MPKNIFHSLDLSNKNATKIYIGAALLLYTQVTDYK